MYIKKKKLISVVALGILLLVSAVAPAYTESYGGAKPAYAQLSPTEQAQEQGSGMTPQGFDQSSKDATADVEQRGLVPCTLTECTFCHLLRLMERIFFWLLSLAFAVAVFFVVVSGFLYIFSIGDSSMMSFAKEGLKLSLIGFVICILSWLSIHLVYTVLGYKGDNWWQIDCNENKTAYTTQEKQVPNPYKNELASNSLGGRSNPIALPDLASQGIAAIPENKYFFIHGIGGQPLKNSAQQIAKITQEAKEQKKIVYAAVPYQDPITGDPIGVDPINLTNYLSADLKVTLDNLENVIINKLISRMSSSEIPLLISDSSENVPQFNNKWPQNVSPDKALAYLTEGGVWYKEDDVNEEQDYSDQNFSFFTINLTYDPTTDKYFLDRDNPISFEFPKDISSGAAREAVVDIAKVVAKSAGYSQGAREDEWNNFVNLLARDPVLSQTKSQETSSGYEEEEEEEEDPIFSDLSQENNFSHTYDSGAFPAGIVRNSEEERTAEDSDKAFRELEELAKSIIDDEFGDTDVYSESSSRKSGNRSSGAKPKRQPSPTPVITSPGSSTEELPTSELPPILSSTGNEEDFVSPERKQGSNKFPSIPSTENYPTISPEYSPVGGTNVNRVNNYDLSQLSPIRGKITTSNILSLEEREEIRNMMSDIRKEMAETGGVDLNVSSDFAMCLFYKETFHHTINSRGKKEPESFDASAMSTTGCSGLGQLEMSSAKAGLQYLKKYAPKHFEALSKKVSKERQIDMEKLIMSDNNQEKRKLLRSDPNLNAAISYALLNEKKRGSINGKGKPIGNDQDLRNLAHRYGPGEDQESNYPDLVMKCYQNNAWRRISEAGQKAIDARKRR